jgi:enamine deaminase RidA (YjgF/YER057c/UK114 family)
VEAGTVWGPVVGYARAVRVGNVIHVGGTTGLAPDGTLARGDMHAQAMQALRNIETALLKLGAGMADVVRTRMYVTDIARWEDVGRAHSVFFRDVRPAATMVQVTALIDPDMLVEIEAEAVLER